MLKIYITDLAAYNKGFLIGEWVSLPTEEKELNFKIASILKQGESVCTIEYEYERHKNILSPTMNGKVFPYGI